jgi:hypothetical protein
VTRAFCVAAGAFESVDETLTDSEPVKLEATGRAGLVRGFEIGSRSPALEKV